MNELGICRNDLAAVLAAKSGSYAIRPNKKRRNKKRRNKKGA